MGQNTKKNIKHVKIQKNERKSVLTPIILNMQDLMIYHTAIIYITCNFSIRAKDPSVLTKYFNFIYAICKKTFRIFLHFSLTLLLNKLICIQKFTIPLQATYSTFKIYYIYNVY